MLCASYKLIYFFKRVQGNKAQHLWCTINVYNRSIHSHIWIHDLFISVDTRSAWSHIHIHWNLKIQPIFWSMNLKKKMFIKTVRKASKKVYPNELNVVWMFYHWINFIDVWFRSNGRLIWIGCDYVHFSILSKKNHRTLCRVVCDGTLSTYSQSHDIAHEHNSVISSSVNREKCECERAQMRNKKQAEKLDWMCVEFAFYVQLPPHIFFLFVRYCDLYAAAVVLRWINKNSTIVCKWPIPNWWISDD